MNAKAYPCSYRVPVGNGIQGYDERYEAGMDLRDYFAGAALNGMLASPSLDMKTTPKDAADWAYKAADAMIARRYSRDGER